MKTILAVAITALVCSAGATAVTKALITSPQIMDGTIQMRDLSVLTKLSLSGSTGYQGVRSGVLNRDLEELCRAVRELQFKIGASPVAQLYVCVYDHPRN